MLDSANSNNRENDRRVLGLTGAGLSRVLLLPAILTGEILLRVLGLTAEVLYEDLDPRPGPSPSARILSVGILSVGVLVSVVLVSWVLAAGAFVRGLILISNWAHRDTIHHIRGRECHIIQVVDIVAAAICATILA